MAIDIVGSVTSAVPALLKGITTLFKSKKRHVLFYFEPATGTWNFAYWGKEYIVNAHAKEYKSQGYHTKKIRDKEGTIKTYTGAAPAGYEKIGGSTNWLMVGALVAIVGIVLFMILKRKRKR